MIAAIRTVAEYRELLAVLAWKDISVRYKQAYLGIAWAVIKPLTLMLLFTLLRSFVGIDSGNVPYPVLAFAALLPWTLFQEATSTGVVSVVGNAHLIRKIYFPREIFPITAVVTKLLEFCINFMILMLLMWFYGILPGAQALWVPLIVFYLLAFALGIALLGAAANVYYRDVGAAIPLALSLLMYASPIIYPLDLVKEKLLVQRPAAEWSEALFMLYTLNPLAGIIDCFQRVLLKGLPPDPQVIWPGLLLTAVLLPLSYSVFKRAEAWFADVI
jgi:lipopolysaccharide transport system permease protein